MCDCHITDCGCCEQQNYRLQPCNGLQCCDPCEPIVPVSKLTPQHNRNSKTQARKSTQRNSSGTSRKMGNKNNSAKKANRKSNQSATKCKSNKGDDVEWRGSNDAVTSNTSCSGSDSEETLNERNRKSMKYDDNLSKGSGQDSMMGMLQKTMDHTMRAYFMHTMEKVECLSAQLLRNECLMSKMHLDIVEKICVLNQRNLTQFQALVERLNYISKEQMTSHNASPYSSRFYNSEEEEHDFGFDADFYDETDLRRSRRSHPSQTFSLLPMKSIPDSCSTELGNFKVYQDMSNTFTNTAEKKQDNSINMPTEEEFEAIKGECSSEEKMESECYMQCQEKVKSLQEALESSKRDLDASLKRLKELENLNNTLPDYEASQASVRKGQSRQDSSKPTTSKQCLLDEADIDKCLPQCCCCKDKFKTKKSR